MTQSPSGLVPEGTEITFTCVTGEANPTASVGWTFDGISAVYINSTTVAVGLNGTMKAQSVLVIIADKTFHDRTVKCVLSDNTEVSAEETLNIECVWDIF